MLKRIFCLMAIMLAGCSDDGKELHPLSMPKIAYTGNELRTDGYYYSNPTSENDRGIAVFYRDGVCLHNFTRIQSQDTFDFIENDFLLNKALMSGMWNTPSHIGVFHINNQSLKFEIWQEAYEITTFSHFAEIVNDTTFVLTKWINNDINRTFTENLTYHFKQFSPKPDSTNRFIK